MAKIRVKNNKRHRVQITPRKEVWDKYSSNQTLAKELKVEIDLSDDFSNWLARQNEQVAQMLQQVRQDQQGDTTQSVTVSDKCNVLVMSDDEVTSVNAENAEVLFAFEEENDGNDND